MFHSQSHYFMSGSYNCNNCFGRYRKAVTEETLFSLILDLFLFYKYQLLMYFGVIKQIIIKNIGYPGYKYISACIMMFRC